MKKILSALLIMAMVISCVSMVVFAQGTAAPPEAQIGGASVIATNRTHRCSSPSQNLLTKIQEEGLGTYYVSGSFRFLQTPDKPVNVSLGIEILADTSAYPQTAKLAVQDTKWHTISGTWAINAENITSAKTFAQMVYQGMSLSTGAYLGDMEWDAMVVCRVYDDGTYSENLFINPNMNIDTNGNTVGWEKNASLTLSNSLTIPTPEGGAMRSEDRKSNKSGPLQVLTGRLEKGTYYYSGYVRLLETPSSAQSFKLGLECKLNGTGVAWLHTSAVSISDTEWHKTSGTITVSKDFDTANTYVNGAGYASIDLDSIFLAKKNADGTFSENIILNPTMECDETGATPEWGLNGLATLSNTGYDPDAIRFNGVENPDGTISYANGYVPVTDKNIVYSGRWYDLGETSKQVAFEGYTEIKFTGTTIKVIPGIGNAYAEIDGTLGHTLYNMDSGSYIVSGLAEGEHTLKLFSKAQGSRFSIGGFVLDENAKTLPIDEPKKIEFIGDSISEGYVDPTDKLSDLDANSYLNSFTLKTGRKLNEEYGWSFNTIAYGGIGMVKTGSPDPLTMPERYFVQREYSSSTDGTTKATALSAAGAYDTSAYTPDYIVINMGTNDSNQDNKTFIDSYVDFISDLKEAYPDVTVFCMTPFNGSKRLQVRMVADSFGIDNKVICVDSAAWGIPGGADGLHPAPASLDIAAEKLFAVIKDYVDKGIVPELEAYANGMQFNVTSDVQYGYPYFRAGSTNATGLTKEMADENGYIERSYTVYNVGNCDLKIRVYLQTGWDDLIDDTAYVTSTVKKGTKQIFTVKIQIDENGMATRKKDSAKVALSTLTFRTQIENSKTSGDIIPQGAAYILTPNDPLDLSVLNISASAIDKGTNGVGAVSFGIIKELPKEEFTGATLDIGSSLTLNYMASLWENTDAIVRITHKNLTTELQGVYDPETGLYKFKYTNVNPQCMADNIKAELIVDGKVISVKDNYSVKAYADSLAKKTAEELNMTEAKHNALISLLSDMLVYGTEAQKYQSYNLTEYATDGITWLNASEFVIPTDGVRNIVSGNTDTSNRVEASGVYVANVNKIYFCVTLTDDVTVLVDGKEATPDAEGKVYTDDILATGFGTVHTVELVKGEETIAKIEYNLNAYVQVKYDTDTVGSIVRAISNYGTSAKAYASAQ